MKLQDVLPEDIERRSMEIITEELGDRVLDPENEAVIKRVIHTTADFEYADRLVFSPEAVRRGVDALCHGASIVTDTEMARAGITSAFWDGWAVRPIALWRTAALRRRLNGTARRARRRRCRKQPVNCRAGR